MNEKQAREEHLLYKATIGMDMSDGDYNKLFGKVKTEVQQCQYDSEFKCMLVHNVAKTRLQLICGCSEESEVENVVNAANFIKIERLGYLSGNNDLVDV